VVRVEINGKKEKKDLHLLIIHVMQRKKKTRIVLANVINLNIASRI
jgi:hypothetical protein